MRQQYDQLLVPPKPFVKWAGGKRQLISVLDQNLPKHFGTYHEPFLGGGALLFHLLSHNNNQKCSVSDLNSNLVLSYTTIRDKIDQVISSLQIHEKNYRKNSSTYYYQIRDEIPKSDIEKTSRLLFLNRTCFNGLYRVNSKGKFNVPLGKYTNPNIVNEENLRSVSHILQTRNLSITCRDFEAVLDETKKGDFVYFDPPYQPVSSTANFTSYTHKDFTSNDLTRLVNLCMALDSKGCHVMLSNSDSDEVTKMFSEKPWRISRIQANRAINSNSKKRTGHFELLIKNY